MLILLTAAVTSMCLDTTVEAASQSVLRALSQEDYRCLRYIILNPDLKFNGENLDPAVIDSLRFHAPGNRSYRDLIKGGVRADVAGSGDKRSVFFVSRVDWPEYVSNKKAFKKSFYLKRYFVCNFVRVGRRWKLTEDLCFTEGD